MFQLVDERLVAFDIRKVAGFGFACLALGQRSRVADQIHKDAPVLSKVLDELFEVLKPQIQACCYNPDFQKLDFSPMILSRVTPLISGRMSSVDTYRDFK